MEDYANRIPQGIVFGRNLLIMIFITVGSQKFQFNRLLEAVDKLVEDGTIKEEVYGQTGYSDYEPQHYKFKKFMDRDEFSQMEEEANIVITHGGTGAIIGAVKKGKKVIAVPRRAKYGEHVDDHQLQLLKEFEEMNIIMVCQNLDDLANVYDQVGLVHLNSYQSNQMMIVDSIDKFIEGIEIKN